MEGKAHVYTHLSNVIKHPGWGCSVNHKYRRIDLFSEFSAFYSEI